MLSFVFELYLQCCSSLFIGKERCSVAVLRYGHAHWESVESGVSKITVFYC